MYYTSTTFLTLLVKQGKKKRWLDFKVAGFIEYTLVDKVEAPGPPGAVNDWRSDGSEICDVLEVITLSGVVNDYKRNGKEI